MTNIITNSISDTQIKKRVMSAIKQSDADQAFEICSELLNVQRLSGLALAEALWLIQQYWDEFGIEDDFYDNAALRLDIHRHTVERYVKIHHMIAFDAPKEIVPTLQERSINELVPVANALDQNYAITPDQWQKIADAENKQEIARIVREEVKGTEARSNGIFLSLDRMGTLWAFNQEQRYFIGSVEINNEDEIVQKAINRLLNNAGVQRQ